MQNANIKAVETNIETPATEAKDASSNASTASSVSAEGSTPGFLSKTSKLDGSWDQVKSGLQKQWSKFTEEDLKVIEGNRKLLNGKLQERYTLTQIEADKQVADWKAAA